MLSSSHCVGLNPLEADMQLAVVVQHDIERGGPGGAIARHNGQAPGYPACNGIQLYVQCMRWSVHGGQIFAASSHRVIQYTADE